MNLSRPVTVGVTTVADPVKLGPHLEGGASGSVGARRLRDLPEVWAAQAGTHLIQVDDTGAVSLVPQAQLAGTGYRHIQLAAATTWEITHGLGFHPAGIVIRDSAGDITEFADVTYPDPDTMHLVFGRAISGTAELS